MNRAVLFDFDGVLVDTEYTTFLYYKKTLSDRGIILQDSDYQYKKGKKSLDFFNSIFPNGFDKELMDAIIKEKRQTFLNDIETYVKPVAGVNELLNICKKNGFTLALTSQNERDLIEKSIDTYKIRDYFHTILSMQDIENKKPDPEIYLLALKNLGCYGDETIVIDDSPEGIQGAKLAGCKTIGVAATFDPATLAGADMVVGDIREISLKHLLML